MNLSDTDQALYSTPAPQTATVSDEAVQAFCEIYYGWWKNEAKGIVRQNVMPNVTRALTAALPHLALSAAPCSVEVKKLTWVNTKPETNDVWLCPENPEYEITRWWLDDTQDECGHFEVSELDEQQFGALEEAKAAAQADFERRILSQIVTKPVDVAAVRRQAFEEAKAIAFDTSENGQYMGNGDCSGHSIYQQGATEVYDALCDLISDISPAEPVDQWQDIATAPKDGEPILIWKPDEHRVGEYLMSAYWCDDREGFVPVGGIHKQGYYSDTAQCNQGYPTHWMPLPTAPTSKGGE